MRPFVDHHDGKSRLTAKVVATYVTKQMPKRSQKHGTGDELGQECEAAQAGTVRLQADSATVDSHAAQTVRKAQSCPAPA